jgi:hypothetical protein
MIAAAFAEVLDELLRRSERGLRESQMDPGMAA